MRIIKVIIVWIFVQFYVSFVLIFLSKNRLYYIAKKIKHHPLAVFHSSHRMGVWWSLWIIYATWGLFTWPLFNFLIFNNFITAYSEFIKPDLIIFFGTLKFSLFFYVTSILVSCYLILLFQDKITKKLKIFRSFQ